MLKIEHNLWIFRAYISDIHYKLGIHFDEERFYNHSQMKTFSGEHSAKWKEKYPEYVSMYWKYTLDE